MYEIVFWEAKRIYKGYRKRHRLEQQLLRLTAYFSCFAMRENKSRKTPEQWLPLPWEEDEGEETAFMTKEEKQGLQDDMAAYQAYLDEQQAQE